MQFSTLQLEEMLREKGIDPDSLPTKEHDEMMKALMCSGGSGGGASTWKDLGEGEPVLTGLVPETTVTLEDQGGIYTTQLTSEFTVEQDKKYRVEWDGKINDCVGVNAGYGMLYLGNIALAGSPSAPNSGEPFLLVTQSGTMIVAGNSAGEHTFTVYDLTPNYNIIPNEYLPIVTREKPGAMEIIDLGRSTDYDTLYEAWERLEDGTARVFVEYHELLNLTVGSNKAYYIRKDTPTLKFMVEPDENGMYSLTESGEVNAITPAYVLLASPGGKRFRITVSDSGTLSATEVT